MAFFKKRITPTVHISNLITLTGTADSKVRLLLSACTVSSQILFVSYCDLDEAQATVYESEQRHQCFHKIHNPFCIRINR